MSPLAAVVFSVVCGALALPAVASDEQPINFGAGVRLGTDDNVFRAPTGQEVSSNVASLNAFAGVDMEISRQRLRGQARVQSTRYLQRSDLNNNGYGIDLSWRGSSIERLSWTLAYGLDRQLSSYSSIVLADQRVANLETSQRATLDVQLGLAAQWLALASLSHRQIDYSAAAYDRDEISLDSLGLSARWNPLGPLSLQAGPRVTSGRQPKALTRADGSFAGERFTRYDIDLGATWVASGASTLDARLSLTRQRYELLSDRDFSGATGRFAWAWTPSGKTRLNTALSRDTGSETSFFTLAFLGTPAQGTGDSSQLTTRLTSRVDYELTGKIQLNATASVARRSLASTSRLVNNGLVLVSESGSENSASLALGASYQFLRNAQAACELQHARRSTSTSLSSPFRSNTAFCSAQFAVN